jgi:hypothetical protein
MPVINRYTATGILVFLHGCNRKLYSTHILRIVKNKKNLSPNTIQERHELNVNSTDYATKQKQQLSLAVL